ncbi:tRNA1Val (adenine37-N6)-methyltransferase [Vibrio hangzhouensis]|uniref:tRNA1(Val) (adenine(37)-N6)-methyltransferase n=2 Tax=Vibrio hangzhouensis TaxID=462991 RepID=A0A1H5UBU9_9VIBR|nr:tRNA1Val (adenine37-N6)-methyltransferase [Vibrio hangzhouensis]
MPVSTDGILLGAWANFSMPEHLLDIGCGTGLLSLMLAQRFPNATIQAVDIDPVAIKDASYNVAHSPWQHRIDVTHGDITCITNNLKYSGIICNPPYFNSGEQSANQRRATARHTDSLTHEQLLDACWQLLCELGEACFVLPKVEGEQFIQQALKKGWYLHRICRIQATNNKACNRLLFAIGKQSREPSESVLVIHSEGGGYSRDFIALTREFYLKM